MERTTIGVGIVTAILNGIAFVLYNRQSRKGESIPNAASWSIWVFTATLNAFSYREMSGDTVITLPFFVGSAGCLFTFLHVLIIGKFSRLKPGEWATLIFGVLATLVWWKFRSATGANMIILLASVISFIPTFLGVLKDPFKERPLPWSIWTLAFFIAFVNVLLRGGKFITLLAPLTVTILHGSIVFLSREKRRERLRM